MTFPLAWELEKFEQGNDQGEGGKSLNAKGPIEIGLNPCLQLSQGLVRLWHRDSTASLSRKTDSRALAYYEWNPVTVS